MKSAVRQLGTRRVKAVIVPSLNPLFRAVDEEMSVFYAKDDYVAGARLMGINVRRLERRARRQPRDADLVVAVSAGLVSSLTSDGVEPLFVPNGCDVDAYRSTTAPAEGEPPIVAFVGHLSERVDVTLLEAVARTGVQLLFVGARQTTMSSGHFDSIFALPNVRWLGAVPYSSLPEVLSQVTTCVLPYSDSAFNRASFPLKALEYLAAGRRVISSDLPAVRWLDTELISIAHGTEDFARLVEESLATPLTPAEIDERKSFAHTHSWESRVKILASALGLGDGPAASPEPVRARLDRDAAP
jgi:teichuronic acid biosynthesis glycosyltransferase TuaH